ncbi:MAG: RNA ligase [Chloroflexota bacterium]
MVEWSEFPGGAVADPARVWMPTREAVARLRHETWITVRDGVVPGLRILNYTVKAQFKRMWTDEVRACRGLIVREVDSGYEVVKRPFPKFFNLGEPEAGAVPQEPFVVYEKMDGALGIIYERMDGPAVATRGSFNSEPARLATHLLRERWPGWRPDPELTFLVEIIHPHWRIVVDYEGRQDLVLLAVVETATGREVPLEAVDSPLPRVPRHDGLTDLDTLTAKGEANREGFVVHWPASGRRMKVKFSEYLRIHRLVTGVTERRVWDLLATGAYHGSLMAGCPEGYQKWVGRVATELRERHDSMLNEARDVMARMPALETRREQAVWIKDQAKVPPLAFKLLDGASEEEVSELIWKFIKPEASRPYVVEV